MNRIRTGRGVPNSEFCCCVFHVRHSDVGGSSACYAETRLFYFASLRRLLDLFYVHEIRDPHDLRLLASHQNLLSWAIQNR